MASKTSDTAFLILGNQLFPKEYLKDYKNIPVYMAEDYGLCTYVKHHKKKIILFLTAMRDYADELNSNDYDVHYQELNVQSKEKTYEERLVEYFPKLKTLISFEVEDKFFEHRLKAFCEKHNIEWKVLTSPMFTCTRDKFAQYLEGQKKPFMKTFYQQQRQDLNILMDKQGEPIGGQWSFDTENRKKLPKNVEIPPAFPKIQVSKHLEHYIDLVNQNFKDHPGQTGSFEYGTQKAHYDAFLDHFLKHKLENFGEYQDAITNRGDFLFHSLISPGINLGLITPHEVVEKIVSYHKQYNLPLNSVEGFIRQVIGWREFIRGVYQNFSEKQDTENYWQHKRKLTNAWYEGTTGIPVLDDAIKKAQKTAYNHHIERLMVLGNMMLLCEIDPREAHTWFMELFIDSSDWVMGPNVYGMALFSDGGVFATKPYICGSNYWIKMSDYKKGEWCDAVDGLYWRFIEKHKDFFSKNPRLSMMVRLLDKMKSERKEKIFNAAEHLLERITQ